MPWFSDDWPPAINMSAFHHFGWPLGGQTQSFEECFTNVHFKEEQALQKKGITVDDTTMRYCPSRIPVRWPNLKRGVGALRLFRTWSEDWPEERRMQVWMHMVRYIKENDVKVLVGTPVSCDVEADKRDWGWTKQFLTLLGPGHVMGFAVGNELELLYKQVKNTACIRNLWDGGGLWSTFTSRVDELDRMGFGDVLVTSVFTAGILYSGDKYLPFVNIPGQALVNSFLRSATQKYGLRYVFTLNIYPYFDPKLKIDPPQYTCESAIDIATCFGEENCLVSQALIKARKSMQQLTSRQDYPLWIGEIGWSSPQADDLGTEMAECADFSSVKTLRRFYENFLKWDLTVNGVRDPDFAFYFTMRDALNFGKLEHFGLIDSCNSPVCKIHSRSFSSPVALRGGQMEGLRLTFIVIGLVFMLLACCTALVKRRSIGKHAGRGDESDSGSESS